VGNGDEITIEGLVRVLHVKVQGYTLNLPVYLLPISSIDLVLGVAWLAILGPHISDYSKLTLKFYLGNQFVTLNDEQHKLPTPTKFHHLSRRNHTTAISDVFTLHDQHLVL